MNVQEVTYVKQTLSMEIPLGYRILNKSKRLKIWEAENILTSRKQRYYTKAVRNGADAELVGSYLVCPFCGKEFVTNTNYSDCVRWKQAGSKRVPKQTVKNWSSLQQSFFDERENKALIISAPMRKPRSFRCPACDNTSSHSDAVKNVRLTLFRKKITMESEVSNISELFAFKWMTEESFRVTFPMYECLTFNLRRGSVYIRLKDEDGNVLCQRDVTPYPELLCGSIANSLITENKKVQRSVKRMFASVWGCKLPYNSRGISMKSLFEMTLFVGYTRAFYNAVPYKADAMQVDGSFRINTKKMHNAGNVVKLYAQSELPKAKSIRRIFFQKPALFFYLEEAEMLWNAIGDYNLYCAFLESDVVFEVLSDMHMRPGIIEYITDFCRTKNAHSFVKNIQQDWTEIFARAIDYCCARPEVKKAIRDSWISGNALSRSELRKPSYSIPMKSPEERITDCCIDGYTFFWLRTSREYEKAGEAMNNCLGTWHTNNSPVVCVRKEDEYVAAIEIENGIIVQARGLWNMPIEYDEEFSEVFEKWKQKYKLRKKIRYVMDDMFTDLGD